MRATTHPAAIQSNACTSSVFNRSTHFTSKPLFARPFSSSPTIPSPFTLRSIRDVGLEVTLLLFGVFYRAQLHKYWWVLAGWVANRGVRTEPTRGNVEERLTPCICGKAHATGFSRPKNAGERKRVLCFPFGCAENGESDRAENIKHPVHQVLFSSLIRTIYSF